MTSQWHTNYQNYTFRSKTARFRFFKHRAEMVIFRQAVFGFVVDSIITRNVSIAICPEQSDQVTRSQLGGVSLTSVLSPVQSFVNKVYPESASITKIPDSNFT